MAEFKQNILNLSALDYGGAGKYAVDFNKLLRREGHSSYLVVKDARSNDENVIQYIPYKFENLWARLKRRIAKRRISKVEFEYDYYFYDKFQTLTTVSANHILALLPQTPDIIFVHWVTDFINAKIIHELYELTQAKIYWLMIDNAPITGGCHYPWQCKGFEIDCSNCPAIIEKKYKGIAKDNFEFKKKYLPETISIIAFSESDYQRAIRASAFKNVIKWVGVVDETKFTQANKNQLKAYFGLSPNQKVVFCGASSLKEKRKGMHLLLEVIKQLESQNIIFLMAGSFMPTTEINNLKLLGELDEEQLIKVYQAADVFVCPSLEDSGPMMINQSMMCGTPVVAFPVGVALDLVKNGQTGYIAEWSNTERLNKAMMKILELSQNDYQIMSDNCREMAFAKYSVGVHTKLITDLINY